jgi:hypothetical protein
MSVRSFKEIIEELIRDKFNHSDANIVAWYTTMLATFPFTIPLLWAQVTCLVIFLCSFRAILVIRCLPLCFSCRFARFLHFVFGDA